MKISENSFNKIISLIKIGDFKDALTFLSKYEKDKNIFFLLSLVKFQLKKYNEALIDINKALIDDELNINYLNNKALILTSLDQSNEALKVYDRIISINPSYTLAYQNKLNLLNSLNMTKDRLFFFEKIKKEKKIIFDYIDSHLFQSKLDILNWKNYDDFLKKFLEKTKQKKRSLTPFLSKLILDDPCSELEVSKIYSNYLLEEKQKNINLKLNFSSKNEKINIGFFSSDFTHHPTALLSIGLLKNLNKKKFNIHIFDYGKIFSKLNEEIRSYSNYYVNISSMGDEEVISLSQKKKIDIAFDLNGYTNNNRSSLFLKRLANIQVNYLAFPGSLGHKSYDYIIVDENIICEENKNFFSEKFIILPGVYQVNNFVSYDLSSKKKYENLKQKNFIYSYFGSHKKLNPKIATAWVKILQSTNDSFLKIMLDDQHAKLNFLNFFKKNNIKQDRILFEKKINYFQHMQRFKLSDLFLDTFPCGSHTTASEALYMGLPLLSIVGKSFQSRVAFSFLKNLKLDYLICKDFDEYIQKAIELYHDSKKLFLIKKKLQTQRSNKVFDPISYTKNFEKKVIKIYEENLKYN